MALSDTSVASHHVNTYRNSGTHVFYPLPARAVLTKGDGSIFGRSVRVEEISGFEGRTRSLDFTTLSTYILQKHLYGSMSKK
jgi:hypothetical protein